MFKFDLGDAVEPQALPNNTEVKARILRGVTSQSGEYLIIWMEVPDEPMSKEFSHPLRIPDGDSMSAKELNTAKWEMKEFFDTFGFDYSREFDPAEDLQGCEGWVILGVNEKGDYAGENNIKKLIPPK
jgi:hypothetical protein